MILLKNSLIYRLFTLLITCLSFNAIHGYSPDEPVRPSKEEMNKKVFLPNRDKNKALNDVLVEGSKIYKELDSKVCQTPLPMEAFLQAYLGYQNLKSLNILDRQSHILSIVDYSKSANIPRLWVIDMSQKKILFNTLVAHGQGTGEEYAVSFSNRDNSHQTSLGFFLTDTTYYGRNGYSLRLHGLDKGYNDRALDRAIVIHGASYVSEQFIKDNERLGRSWGCPALPVEYNATIIDIIRHGNLFFAYYPDNNYITSSIWLNQLPQKNTLPTAETHVMHAHNDTTLQKNSTQPNSL